MVALARASRLERDEGSPAVPDGSDSLHWTDEQRRVYPIAEPTEVRLSKLHRGLSARQVQMIAVAGTIGTGLFLGTGRSLAQGGPASMLICYAIVGFIVYLTLLLLGEMATQYPVAGEFRFLLFWKIDWVWALLILG